MQLQKGPLRVRHLLWKSILGSNPNFGDVKFQEVYFPLGAWSPDMTNQELQLGKLMNENLQNVIQAIGSGLRQSQSWSQDELNSLLEGALRELKELPPCVQGYSRWVFATAVRSDALWKSREQPWTGPAELDPYDYLIRPANETSSA
ncbi:hypothetical protein M407DRAFT_117473 [Tulasnella calospora MUT 4182]|uniref:Uncharacterized protein n=1 Tax=Tulasnella calospora MUT 4182 TaxID=1051891 RepID=A0A0C3KMA7_9AGAM|nr:hypothetical protein M407DRAFT_117473 [Tulasnella calospora MUT 4182]